MTFGSSRSKPVGQGQDQDSYQQSQPIRPWVPSSIGDRKVPLVDKLQHAVTFPSRRYIRELPLPWSTILCFFRPPRDRPYHPSLILSLNFLASVYDSSLGKKFSSFLFASFSFFHCPRTLIDDSISPHEFVLTCQVKGGVQATYLSKCLRATQLSSPSRSRSMRA